MLYPHVNDVQRNKQGPPFQTLVRFAWLRFLWPHGYAKFSMYMQASNGTNIRQLGNKSDCKDQCFYLFFFLRGFCLCLLSLRFWLLKPPQCARCHIRRELDVVKPSHQNSKETSFSLGSLFFEALHIHKGKKAILHLTRMPNNGTIERISNAPTLFHGRLDLHQICLIVQHLGFHSKVSLGGERPVWALKSSKWIHCQKHYDTLGTVLL